MSKLSGVINVHPPGGFNLPGPLGSGSPEDSPNQLASVLTMIIGVLTVVAAIWFLFKLVSGAIGVISSGGDKGKLANARGDITYGLVGILIVVTATTFVNFILGLLGIGSILNIQETITRLIN